MKAAELFDLLVFGWLAWLAWGPQTWRSQRNDAPARAVETDKATK